MNANIGKNMNDIKDNFFKGLTFFQVIHIVLGVILVFLIYVILLPIGQDTLAGIFAFLVFIPLISNAFGKINNIPLMLYIKKLITIYLNDTYYYSSVGKEELIEVEKNDIKFKKRKHKGKSKQSNTEIVTD